MYTTFEAIRTNREQHLLERLWKAREPAALFAALPDDLIDRIFSYASASTSPSAAAPVWLPSCRSRPALLSDVEYSVLPPLKPLGVDAVPRQHDEPEPRVPFDAAKAMSVALASTHERPMPSAAAQRLVDEAVVSRNATIEPMADTPFVSNGITGYAFENKTNH